MHFENPPQSNQTDLPLWPQPAEMHQRLFYFERLPKHDYFSKNLSPPARFLFSNSLDIPDFRLPNNVGHEIR
jgi:hypothetical protein